MTNQLRDDRIASFVDAMEGNAARPTVPPVLYIGSREGGSSIMTPSAAGVVRSERLVRATDDYRLALIHAGYPFSNVEINVSYVNGRLIVTEIIPRALEDRLCTPGYVHHIQSDAFERISPHEYVSYTRKKLTAFYTESIHDVLLEMTRNPITIYRYPRLPSFIKDRIEFIKQVCIQNGEEYGEWIMRVAEMDHRIDVTPYI